MANDIRDELLRFIALNYVVQWVPTRFSLQQLEPYNERLIPGLIECLTDEDSEVRELAVSLLNEARPRSNVAVPALIERLSDEDRLVRVAVLGSIADFGSLAVAAIPFIEPWLEFPEEYLRILAATSIALLDPFAPSLFRTSARG